MCSFYFRDKLLLSVLVLFIWCLCYVSTSKYRVCVVDGRGGFKRAGKYCPTLDRQDSQVECVIGVDRLDCLRRISKGKADFTVLTAEDLVTAINSQLEVLITNELRFTNDSFEYDVVAVVNKFADITSTYDLQGKRLCHPGYGYKTDWTTILANFLEATIVPPSCDPNLSLPENRIKSSSEFFQASCKAGPWVSNPDVNLELKLKYSNLCDLCDNPKRCATTDKFWGRRGPLYCLTDGAGDIAWARLDDVHAHFGVTPGANAQGVDMNNYNLLCRDGTLMPINSIKPCSWVSRPWQVIAAQRSTAAEIQKFITSLSHDEHTSWESALLNLIETYHFDISTVSPILTANDYLAKATGFLSANSFSGCHPPRTIRICTTSNIENAKCNWLREAAAVYGIEPDIGCLKSESKLQCMEAISKNLVDIVFIHPDYEQEAIRDHKLKTLVYESTHYNDFYMTVAVVKNASNIMKLEDLRGRRACFPKYEGVAWNTVLNLLMDHKLLSYNCPYYNEMDEFFSDSCVPQFKNQSRHLTKLCSMEKYNGDSGAFRCLAEGKGEVAFIDLNTLTQFTDGNSREKWAEDLKSSDFRILCFDNHRNCGLSWAPPAQAMIREDLPLVKEREMFDALMQIDQYFGNHIQSLTRPFTLYGPFDGQRDILFLDKTDKLVMNIDVDKYRLLKFPTPFKYLTKFILCIPNSSSHVVVSVGCLLLIVINMLR